LDEGDQSLFGSLNLFEKNRERQTPNNYSIFGEDILNGVRTSPNIGGDVSPMRIMDWCPRSLQ